MLKPSLVLSRNPKPTTAWLIDQRNWKFPSQK